MYKRSLCCDINDCIVFVFSPPLSLTEASIFDPGDCWSTDDDDGRDDDWHDDDDDEDGR